MQVLLGALHLVLDGPPLPCLDDTVGGVRPSRRQASFREHDPDARCRPQQLSDLSQLPRAAVVMLCPAAGMSSLRPG